MVQQVKHLPHQPEDLSSTLDTDARVRILTLPTGFLCGTLAVLEIALWTSLASAWSGSKIHLFFSLTSTLELWHKNLKLTNIHTYNKIFKKFLILGFKKILPGIH